MSSNDETDRNMKNPVVAIAGATGAVGVELMQCLEQRKFPLSELRLLASARSVGKSMKFRGGDLRGAGAHRCQPRGRGHRAVLGGRRAVEALRTRGGAGRRGGRRQLVVLPHGQGRAAGGAGDQRRRHARHNGIIANPNCVAIVAATPLWPLHQKRRIKRIIMSTYQAASGAGAAAMEELSESTRAHLEGRAFTPKVLPHPYAFNVFSHNTKVDPETGYNEEETKVMQETRKIFGEPDLRVTATCVRVPVLRAHCIALNIESEEPLSPAEARAILADAPGVRVVDDMERNYFPMPVDASGKDEVLVGRIRRDVSDPTGCTLALFVAGDQLRKGAALNAVQIAERLLA